MASPDDSMMFVLLKTKPMHVKNTNAVSVTPSSVEDSGDDAAFGYDFGE